MNEAYRQQQLARIKAAMEQCDRVPTPAEVAAAEAHLDPWRTRVKRKVMRAYHRRRLPGIVARIVIRALGLRSA
jgi:hypothetical protein